MQRVTGLPDEQVLIYEARIEALVRVCLDAVMDKIARRVEASMPVLAAALVAADELASLPEPEPLPPGQPYVSPDDLASIPPLWQQAVADQIAPLAAQIFLDAAGRTYANMVEASSIAGLPSVGSLAAEQYLAQATNTFDQVGDHLWAEARTQLLDGFERGESIPQLAARLRASAGLTARTGVLVARTQVIEASNAGSFATAQASGLQMKKEWMCVASGTVVAAVQPLHVVERRRTAGWLATLSTNSGRLLTVTPNHPVLTDRGWVRAHSLHVGDNLICHRGQQAMPGNGPDVQHVPVKVDQVFRALTQDGARRGVMGRATDLYSDPVDCEIEVVPVDGDLAADMQAALGEPASNSVFALTDAGLGSLATSGAMDQLRLRHRDGQPDRSATVGHLGGPGPGLPFALRAGAFPLVAHFPGCALVPDFDPTGTQDAGQGAPPVAVALAEHDERVSLDDVELDELVNVEVNWSASGHSVYDLTTDRGWFTANGIVVHNSTPDLRTRPAHLAADGQRVGLEEPFIVGGFSGMFPAAPTFPPAQRYSCRCTLGYVMPDRAPAQVRVDDAQVQQLADLPGTSGVTVEAPPPTVVVPSIRPSLADARTLREVDQAAMAEARRLTGRDIRFDQTGSDVGIAREHAEGILRGLERFPESPLSQVGTYGPGSSAEAITRRAGVADFDEPGAFTATLPGNDVVLFNVRMASDPEAYLAALERGRAAGWHARGTATPMGQALHEFGHTVDETFTEAGAKVGAVRSLMTERFTGAAYKEAVRTGVSRYAAKSTHELGGEAFADVMVNGDVASPTSRAVFDAIESGYAKRFPRMFPKSGDVPGEGGADVLEPFDPKSVRLVLVRAGSPDELRTAWQDEMRRITGRDIIVQLPPGMSPLTMREYAEGVCVMLERFPEARLRKISWWDDATSPNYARVAPGSASIEFNAYWAGEAQRRALLRSLRGDVAGWAGPERVGWSVRGASRAQATSFHEFAHILDIETLGDQAKYRAQAIVRRRAAIEGISDDELVMRDISAYAASGGGHAGNELIAEAMTDVMINGGRASATSREIYDLIVADYRAKGLAIRQTAVDVDLEDLGDVEFFPKAAAPRPPATAEDLARTRQAAIDQRRAVAQVLAEVDELVANGASRDVILRGLKAKAAQVGLPKAQLTPLVRAVESGDLAKVRRALDSRAKAAGLEPGSPAGTVVTFDRTLHQALPGSRIADGQRVVIVRRGDVADIDGERVALGKATVEEVSDADIARWRTGAQTWLAELTDAVESRAGADALREIVARGPSLTAGPDLPYLVDALERAAGDRVKFAAALRKAKTQLGDGVVKPVKATRAKAAPEPAAPVDERRAVREAARERNRLIESSQGTGRLLAEVDELIANKATKAALRQRLDPALIAPEQVYAGADPAVLEMLRTALDTGDMAKLRAAVTRAGTKAKLKGVSKAGAKTTFDPETMDGVGGIEIAPGTPVTVVRRGTTLTLPDKTTMQLTRAQVTPVVKATKRVPTPIKPQARRQREATLRKLADREPAAPPLELARGSADTDLLTYADESQAVRKIYRRGKPAEIKAEVDAEVLGSAVVDAIGVRSPAALSPRAGEVLMERLNGKTWEELLRDPGRPDLAALVDSVDGRGIGLADLITMNVDRNEGGWLVMPGGRLGSIDHGFSFGDAEYRNPRNLADVVDQAQFGELDPFVFHYVDRSSGKDVLREVVDTAGLDLPAIKRRLQALKPMFVAQGRADWHEGMMARFAEIEKRSKPKPVKKAAPRKAAPRPAEVKAGEKTLDERAAILERQRKTIAADAVPERNLGGLSADTLLWRTPDGDLVVSKAYGRRMQLTAREAKALQDAEDLGGSVLDAVGVRAPASSRAKTDLQFFEYLEGPTGEELGDDIQRVLIESSDGRLMGIADYLMINNDRNTGNYLRMLDGRLAGLDHGSAFWSHKDVEIDYVPLGSEFAEWLRASPTSPGLADRLDIDPRDLAVIRRRLEALRPRFTELSRSAWFNAMMRRLKELEKRAVGTKPRLVEVVPQVETQAVAREFSAAVKTAAKDQDALDAVPLSAADRAFGPSYVPDALDRYRLGPDVNAALRGVTARGRQIRSSDRHVGDIHDVDRMFDGSRLDRDVELWRGLGSGRSVFGEPGAWGDDLSGFEWLDPAYSSASASKAVADRFIRDGGVRLRMLAPRGSKAIQMSRLEDAGIGISYANEAEILLARGARFRVVRDRGWTEITHPRSGKKIRVRDLDVKVFVPDETPSLPWAATSW